MKLIKFIDSSLGKLLTTVIPTFFTYIAIYNDFDFKNISTEPIHIMSGVILAFVIYGLLTLMQHRQKIKALKKFKDWQMIHYINFNNSEIKNLSDRIDILEEELGLSISSRELNENEKRIFNEEEKMKKKMYRKYNDAFKSWKMNEYGDGDLASYYKKLNHEE